MIRFLIVIAVIGASALIFGWLADNPGTLAVDWFGWRIETSTLVAILAVLSFATVIFLITVALRLLIRGPGEVSLFMRNRRTARGHKAVARGLVAVGAGDTRAALRAAQEAQSTLGEQPITLLLRSQAAQLAGDRDGAKASFKRMLEVPETRALGLRGLYVEANRSGDREAARLVAAEAVKTDPGLPWAASAVLDDQSRAGDWDAAIETIARNADQRVLDRPTSKRLRAVVRTAQAIERADSDPEAAKAFALEAHGLAPDLVPAAALAARLSSASGDVKKATRILEAAWRIAPHPDLAAAYVRVRPGDAAMDRLKRAKALAGLVPNTPEATLAVAAAALEARQFSDARAMLSTVSAGNPSERICFLMAQLADAEDNIGEARQWAQRAVIAPRDPAWCADGYVSDRWLPVSPVTGKLDAFAWKVPVEAAPGTVLPGIALPEVPPAPETAARLPAPVIDVTPASAPPAAATAPAANGAAHSDPPAKPGIDSAHLPDDPGPDPGTPAKKRGFRLFTGGRS